MCLAFHWYCRPSAELRTLTWDTWASCEKHIHHTPPLQFWPSLPNFWSTSGPPSTFHQLPTPAPTNHPNPQPQAQPPPSHRLGIRPPHPRQRGHQQRVQLMHQVPPRRRRQCIEEQVVNVQDDPQRHGVQDPNGAGRRRPRETRNRDAS